MGLFSKLKTSLSKTKESINEKFNTVIKTFKKIDDDLFDELLKYDIEPVITLSHFEMPLYLAQHWALTLQWT